MNPFEPPLEHSASEPKAPFKMRIVALGLVAAGLWHAFFALGEFHPLGWVQLGFAGVSFGLAWLAWK